MVKGPIEFILQSSRCNISGQINHSFKNINMYKQMHTLYYIEIIFDYIICIRSRKMALEYMVINKIIYTVFFNKKIQCFYTAKSIYIEKCIRKWFSVPNNLKMKQYSEVRYQQTSTGSDSVLGWIGIVAILMLNCFNRYFVQLKGVVVIVILEENKPNQESCIEGQGPIGLFLYLGTRKL